MVNRVEKIQVEYTEWGEYVYFATFLVSLGEQLNKDVWPVVTKIWADDYLIYDRAIGVMRPGITIYYGEENQGAIYNGYAYRGQITVLFKDFSLKDFGDRIPSISAELIDGGELTAITGLTSSLLDPTLTYGELTVSGDFIRTGVGSPIGANGVGAAGYIIEQVDTALGVATGIVTSAPGTVIPWVVVNTPPWTTCYSERNDAIFAQEPNYLSRQLNAKTAQPRGVLPGIANPIAAAISITVNNAPIIIGVADYGIFASSFTNQAGTYFTGGILSVCRGRENQIVVVSEFGITVLALSIVGSSIAIDTHASLSLPGGTTPYRLMFDGSKLLYFSKDNPSTHSGRVMALDYDTGNQLWTTDAFILPESDSLRNAIAECTATTQGRTLGLRIASVDDAFTVIDLTTGATSTHPFTASAALGFADPDTPALWHDATQTLFSATHSGFVRLVQSDLGGTYSISDFVTALADRAEFSPDEYELYNLDALNLRGYVIMDGSMTGTINDLSALLGFYSTVDAGKLHVSYPYANDEAVISRTYDMVSDEIAVLNEDGEAVYKQSHVVASSDLPYRVKLSYYSRAADYVGSEQIAGHSFGVVDPQESKQQLDFSLPITLLDGEAVEIANSVITRTWNMRLSQAYRLAPVACDVVPGQAIMVIVDETAYSLLVTDKSINGDNSVSISASNIAPLRVVADPEAQPRNEQTSINGLPVQALIIDVPDTAAQMEQPGVLNLLTVLSPLSEGAWPGAARLDTRYMADQQFITRVVTDTPNLMGRVVSEVPTIQTPFETDYATRLIVARGSIPLSWFVPATYEEMLAGANMAIIGRDAIFEFVQFGSVEILGASHVALTVLFRGRYGTDSLVNQHTSGLYFIPVSGVNPLNVIEFTQVEFQRVRGIYYRGSPIVEPVSPPVVTPFFPMGNSRKPHAPNDVRACYQSNGDIEITWRRRVRFGGELVDYIGTVPLDEATEEYSLDVYNAAGDIVRRVVSLTEGPVYQYTVANQVEDGFTGGALQVAVYQINRSHVGRGFPANVVLDISTCPVLLEASALITTVIGAELNPVMPPLEAEAVVSIVAAADIEPVLPPLAVDAIVSVVAQAEISAPSVFSGALVRATSNGSTTTSTATQLATALDAFEYNTGGYSLVTGGVEIPAGVSRVDVMAGVSITSFTTSMSLQVEIRLNGVVVANNVVRTGATGFTNNRTSVEVRSLAVVATDEITVHWRKSSSGSLGVLAAVETFLSIQKVG